MVRKPKTTLKQVAEAAGVSQSTASRALSGSQAIAADTVARVAATAKALNYATKRKPAIDRQEGRKGVVGMVVAALQNAFYPYLVDRIHDELDALGYDIVLIIDELSNSSSSRKVQGLIDTALDGVLFTTASIHSPAVDLLVEREIPTVLAIRSNKRGNVTVVESDNRMAGLDAARHLLDLGHREVGFIQGPRNTSTAVDRFDGFRSYYERQGLVLSAEEVIWGEYNHEAGYSGFMKLTQGQRPPTAIFCGNDVIALGALDAAHKVGIGVPDEVSIIGVDDIPMASWSMISLTTIRQSIEQIGVRAARRLVDHIESGSLTPISNDILPTSLVRRSTTAPARA